MSEVTDLVAWRRARVPRLSSQLTQQILAFDGSPPGNEGMTQLLATGFAGEQATPKVMTWCMRDAKDALDYLNAPLSGYRALISSVEWQHPPEPISALAGLPIIDTALEKGLPVAIFNDHPAAESVARSRGAVLLPSIEPLKPHLWHGLLEAVSSWIELVI